MFSLSVMIPNACSNVHPSPQSITATAALTTANEKHTAVTFNEIIFVHFIKHFGKPMSSPASLCWFNMLTTVEI